VIHLHYAVVAGLRKASYLLALACWSSAVVWVVVNDVGVGHVVGSSPSAACGDRPSAHPGKIASATAAQGKWI